jgi:hypothetical protein
VLNGKFEEGSLIEIANEENLRYLINFARRKKG